jgi:ribosomal-protein-alanine N-acetyltransferase
LPTSDHPHRITPTGGAQLQTGTTSSGRELITIPRPDQFEDLYRLDQRSFGKAEPYTYFFLRQLFDAFRRDYLVLADGDSLLGYVPGVRNSGEDQATIMALCVAPEYRKRGYGRRLLEAAVKRLRDAGAGSVGLMVNPENKATYELYRTYGFEFARRCPDYFGPGRDRDELCLDLS